MTDLEFFVKYWPQFLTAGGVLLWFGRLEARISRTEEKSTERAIVANAEIKRVEEKNAERSAQAHDKLSTVIHMIDKDMETLRQQRIDDQEAQSRQRSADHAENERRWADATAMLNEVRLDVKKLLGRKEVQ
jgi:hypothetical protein